MKYADCTPENRPIQVIKNLIGEMRFDHRVRLVLGEPERTYVDVVISRKRGHLLKRDRFECCAIVDVAGLRVCIYGDVYKEKMISLAMELERRLAMVPSRYLVPLFELSADFMSHDTKWLV